jgi:amino acid adenylation domain-containing protein
MTLLHNDSYPLTPLQEGLLFHALEGHGSDAYVGQIAYRIRGRLRVDIVERCLYALYERHDILRTVVDFNGEYPRLIKREDTRIGFYYGSLCNVADWSKKEEMMKAFKEGDRHKGFDLSKEIMMRVSVLQLDENVFELILTWHHIIIDGWSIGTFHSEFVEIYDSFVNERDIELPAPAPYQHYLNWMARQNKNVAAEFWTDCLRGYSGITGLPATEKSSQNGYEKSVFTFYLDELISARLGNITRANKVTLNHVLQGLWGILLCKYNNVNDAVFGTVVSGRPPEVENVESMIGLFINTIPVRIKYDARDSFKNILGYIKEYMTGIEPHQYFQLAEIQLRSTGRSQLFDHTLVFQNYPFPELEYSDEPEIKEQANFRDLVISNIDISEHSHYNFNLGITPGEKIQLTCTFNSRKYGLALIEQVIENFAHLAEQVIVRDDVKISELTLIKPHDIDARIEKIANPGNSFIETLVERWEYSVSKHREQIALYFKDRTWSYGTLNEKSNRLAHYLRETAGVIPDDRVAILMEKSDYTVISVLAILKAGAAYLPLDTLYPTGRIQFILEDARPKVLIIQSDYLTTLEEFEGHVFVADLELGSLKTSEQNPEPVNTATDLACCIYTSGTTGFPKGSLIEHYSLLNLTDGLNKLLLLDDGVCLRMAVVASAVFDPFGKQLFWALLNGHSLYVVPEEVKRSGVELWNYYKQHRIDLTDGTPSLLQSLISCWSGGELPVRYWLIGGEVLASKTVLSLYECYRPEQSRPVLVNEYGLTECTVDNCCYTVDSYGIADSDILPIGRPLLHNEIFLLDERLQPVPQGAIGEICIAGAGIGRGYLNQPELTHEKFVSVPSLQELKVFRTGDLGRWLANDELLCLGRKDRQVKIRGHRIEPGEIEQALMKHPYVNEAYIIDRQNAQNERYLVAYLILKQVVPQQELKSYLQKLVPDYTIPAYWVVLEKIPLTVSGKIDKTALPDPEKMQIANHAYVAPHNEMQKMLCGIYEDILTKDQVGIKDNFFEIGGHSLKAVQVIFRLQKELGININVAVIFNNPTVEELATEVENVVLLKNIGVPKGMEGSQDRREIIL